MGAAKAQLIEGVDAWADAIIGLSSTRWVGPRVPSPVPTARPASTLRLDARDVPISVHAAGDVAEARLRAVLEAAEQAHVLLAKAGFLTSFGDGGQAGTGARDLYVQATARAGAYAALDASDQLAALDGGRAFVVVDARLPHDRLLACTARALVEAQLLELDPAEAASLRRSSAAALAFGFTGELGCDESEEAPHEADSPFSPAEMARGPRGAALLRDLDARQDGGRGTFLFDMWQFARQRTWEGRDLRASPDLIEAIAKALDLAHDDFGRIASRLMEEPVREAVGCGEARGVPRVSIDRLPAATTEKAVEPLGSVRLLVNLPTPRPGRRMRVWARSETGADFVLAATRMGAHGEALARIEAETRRGVMGQVSVEIDGDTKAVLISATNVEDGTPDFDGELIPTRVALTVDLAP